MSFKPFQKVYTSPEKMADPGEIALAINTLQANIQASIQPMVQKIQNDSLILKNITLLAANNPTAVNHTLGRILLGYNVMLKANAVVWDSQDSNKSQQLTLLLNTSADVTINLEVY